MLHRVLEPEVMDDPEESRLYDEMDHQDVNRNFVQDLLKFAATARPCPELLRVLDLGTGTARIPILLCEAVEGCRVMACDLAVTMLDLAKLNIASAGLSHRIQLYHGDAKDLDCQDADCDWVISNSLIHHLPSPQVALAQMIRVVRPGGGLFVRDLMRPSSQSEIEHLVQQYANGEPENSQQLLRQSLAAALSLDEMRSLVQQLGFESTSVQPTSDRHWTWAAIKL